MAWSSTTFKNFQISYKLIKNHHANKTSQLRTMIFTCCLASDNVFESVTKYSVAVIAVQSAMRPANLQEGADGPPGRGRGAHFSAVWVVRRQIQRHATRARHGLHSIVTPGLIQRTQTCESHSRATVASTTLLDSPRNRCFCAGPCFEHTAPAAGVIVPSDVSKNFPNYCPLSKQKVSPVRLLLHSLRVL